MVADDMPKSELGSYGAAGELTPRLDALARDAVRFDAAHSPSPLCTPARYSLLTGRHAGCALRRRRGACASCRSTARCGAAGARQH